MGACKFCNKKLGIFEGYKDIHGEYCKNCYDSRINKKFQKKDKELVKRINKKIQNEEPLTFREKIRISGIGQRLIFPFFSWIKVLKTEAFKEEIR